MDATATDGASAAELGTLLRQTGPQTDQHWRSWAAQLMQDDRPTIDDLRIIWETLLDFDPALAAHAREPLAVTQPCVAVAGSGKESFKTFNVSTSASILAAAAGARVVKGVSRSVSAISGSADVLDELGLHYCDQAGDIPARLTKQGIAFVPYGAFCPSYAERYDGVFEQLTPLSFFMPAAVLAVQARAFVYGIAHRDVALAAAAISEARPDFEMGTVVATAFTGDRLMDEAAPYGMAYTAEQFEGATRSEARWQPDPPAMWSHAVRHRDSHRDNLRQCISALSPQVDDQAQPSVELVERNAAVILRAHHAFEISDQAALNSVRTARREGLGTQLLERITNSGWRSIRAR